jgi:kynurenine formamidase
MKIFNRGFFVIFSALFSLAITNAVLADGHGKCKNSKWGADDEIGAANYMSEQSTKLAAKLVKKGKTHPLGIVINSNTPAFPPRSLSLTVLAPNQYNGASLASAFGYHMNYNDDILSTWVGIGSQIDGLGHLGENDMLYNCNKSGDVAKVTGLTKMGVHNIPPMVARGVVIDMAKHFGVETMEAGQAIFAKDLKDAMKNQNVSIGEGDVVLIHTGWTDGKFKSDPKAWGSGEPGTSNDAMEYLMGFNPMAVGADTWGVDAVPPAKGDKVFYGHVTALQNNGVYLLEVMDTGRLAKEGVNEFMFVLGQARVEGTVQMIINPVAIW